MESLSEASRSEGFYTRIVSGIEETAYDLGYQVILHVYRPDVDPINSIRELMGRDINGLIIANDGDVTPQVIQQISKAGLPMVLVENYQVIPIHSVTADNFTAGRIMTEYLIDLGHRRIGGIGGPAKYSSLNDRMRGHQIALAEHGIAVDPCLQPPPVSGHPRKGYVQMQQLLALQEPPTAVFAVSDRAAFGAMEAAKDAGLHIPDDISVVGIDNVRDSAYSTPPLTTFTVPKYDLGRMAVFLLHDLTREKPVPPSRSYFSDSWWNANLLARLDLIRRHAELFRQARDLARVAGVDHQRQSQHAWPGGHLRDAIVYTRHDVEFLPQIVCYCRCRLPVECLSVHTAPVSGRLPAIAISMDLAGFFQLLEIVSGCCFAPSNGFAGFGQRSVWGDHDGMSKERPSRSPIYRPRRVCVVQTAQTGRISCLTQFGHFCLEGVAPGHKFSDLAHQGISFCPLSVQLGQQIG